MYISVAGADRVPLGYFRNKLAAERVVADSGLPWTTLRVAQVHDLVLTVLQAMAKLPVILVPRALRFQPVDAGEVEARLVELTLDKPAGLVPNLAGAAGPWPVAGGRWRLQDVSRPRACPDSRRGPPRVRQSMK